MRFLFQVAAQTARGGDDYFVLDHIVAWEIEREELVDEGGFIKRCSIPITLDDPPSITKNKWGIKAPDGRYVFMYEHTCEDEVSALACCRKQLGLPPLPAKKAKPSPVAEKFLERLYTVVGNEGTEKVSLAAWREACISAGLIDWQSPARKQQFAKYKNELIVRNWVSCDDENVWLLP